MHTMYDMMSGGMMWGMGWAGLLVVAVVAALVKYLFFNSRS